MFKDLRIPPGYRPSVFQWLMLVSLVVMIWSTFSVMQVKILPYSQFLSELHRGNVSEVTIYENKIDGQLISGGENKQFSTTRVDDPGLVPLLQQQGTKFTGIHTNWFGGFVFWIMVFFIVSLVTGSMTSLSQKQGGPALRFNSIEKSGAKIYEEKNTQITFADVASADEAKEELSEVISFLKDPKSYSRLGGRLPKGILLVGPPGTGKTLLARAVAGEAAVPFFSISGSEFVELFVGVGAARVRDLFAEARLKAPCIIFIDELDALGRSRAPGAYAGVHDEKEQTLNQLLVELDGFDTSSGVILLAATNRPEILDEALLRAGRFDRQICVDRPDRTGREQILNVHLRKVVLAETGVDVGRIAALTPGCTGADLANLVNEAALLATRRKAVAVESIDFENAFERMVAGLERRNRLLTDKERRTVAYHEMGHALVAITLGNTDQVQKVSIIPRGSSALGYTIQRPVEDRFLMSRTELINKIATLMGGRAAEKLVLGDPTTGAGDDLQKATQLAKLMITRYGMNSKIGLMTIGEEQSQFLAVPDGSTFAAPDTMREVDCAVRELLNEGLERATVVLTEHQPWLERAALALLQDETLTLEQILFFRDEKKLPIIIEQAPHDDTACKV